MRIEQENGYLVDMVKRIRAGTLAPAAFQRPYVWEAEDVEAMFSSILRGWPLGSFLLWQPSADVDLSRISRGRLGPIGAEGPIQSRMDIVLDGQNRLATIAWAVAQATGDIPRDLGWSDAERSTWLSGRILCADLPTRSVRFFPEDEASSATRIPVGHLCGFSVVNTALREVDRRHGLSDEAFRWFGDVVPDAVSGTKVQTTVLDGASTDEAREAFLHICRVGRPMDPAHFEAAIGWTSEEEPDSTPAPGP